MDTPPGEEGTGTVLECGLHLSENERKTLEHVYSEMKEDPILLVRPLQTWVPMNNVTRDQVLDFIATWNYNGGRRDQDNGAYRWLFHFKNLNEIEQCRQATFITFPCTFGFGIHGQQLVKAAFGQPVPAAMSSMFAETRVVNKTLENNSDVYDPRFFIIH